MSTRGCSRLRGWAGRPGPPLGWLCARRRLGVHWRLAEACWIQFKKSFCRSAPDSCGPTPESPLLQLLFCGCNQALSEDGRVTVSLPQRRCTARSDLTCTCCKVQHAWRRVAGRVTASECGGLRLRPPGSEPVRFSCFLICMAHRQGPAALLCCHGHCYRPPDEVAAITGPILLTKVNQLA